MTTEGCPLKAVHSLVFTARLNSLNARRFYTCVCVNNRCAGEMLDYLVCRQRLNEREARKFVRQVSAFKECVQPRPDALNDPPTHPP